MFVYNLYLHLILFFRKGKLFSTKILGKTKFKKFSKNFCPHTTVQILIPFIDYIIELDLPPSINKFDPFIKLEESLAKKTTAFAISSVFPNRFTGISFFIQLINFDLFFFFIFSHPVPLMKIGPGDIELNVILLLQKYFFLSNF